ncbi:MAG: tetratricopeptide repeat protein [Anaerolineae bacterium]|nr:tetratricopeptide repeat protein [Anaerolineae bacterium]
MDGLSTWGHRFTIYREAGRYDLCRRLLKMIKGQILPPQALAVIHYSEGWLYDRLGDPQRAIGAYQACLQTCEAAQMTEALDIVVMNNIAALYQEQGLWTKSEQTYQQILALAEARQANAEKASVLNNLGILYKLTDRLDEALQAFREARQLFQEAGDARNEAAALHNLGSVYQDQKQSQQALDCYVQSLQAFSEIQNLVGMVANDNYNRTCGQLEMPTSKQRSSQVDSPSFEEKRESNDVYQCASEANDARTKQRSQPRASGRKSEH